MAKRKTMEHHPSVLLFFSIYPFILFAPFCITLFAVVPFPFSSSWFSPAAYSLSSTPNLFVTLDPGRSETPHSELSLTP